MKYANSIDGVLGCYIALAGSGYITSLDTKLRCYIGPVSVLYTIYCMMVRSPAWCTHRRSIYNSPHQRDDVTIILYYT